MNPKELLLTVLHEKDANKSRSKQTQVGPSEIGGCRRKVWYRLNDQPETNFQLKKLAAIMGTAIHSEIEKAIEAVDPNGEKYWVETEVEFNGIKAHIDLFIPETGSVVDWKTVKVKNLSYFPSAQQRWQVQVYGYLLEQSGKAKVKDVNLVAIARDGDEDNVRIHTEPYDEDIALEALEWLTEVKRMEIAPEPEKDSNFCKSYCQYYDESGVMGCTGLKKERIVLSEVVIEDEEVDKNALHFLQLDAKIKELESEKDSLKTSFEGTTGVTASGIEISWTKVKGRESVDKDKVKELIGYVPVSVGQETARLNIKPSGGK
jgi:CRISPR/Cas system-associated exonuclease Cas4 (RecB family)